MRKKYITDTWDKPRGKQDHLTPDELELLRKRYLERVEPRDIARELRCSTRIVYRHIEKMEGRHAATERKRRAALLPPRPKLKTRPTHYAKQSESEVNGRPSEAERKASRFYHSTFEL